MIFIQFDSIECKILIKLKLEFSEIIFYSNEYKYNLIKNTFLNYQNNK